jgi:hypothetical protein
MRRRWIFIAGWWIAATIVAAPASAQIVHRLQLGAGVFFPRGFDSRDPADTIAEDLTTEEPLKFNIGAFRSGQLFAEWDMQVRGRLEFGLGVGFYSTEVQSTYLNLVNKGGGEIQQNLRFRIIPITAVVRLMPFGGTDTLQPYVGGGVSALKWRYSEAGQFVNTSDNSTFIGAFVAQGTSVGPVFLTGVRLPIYGGTSALSLEWRYQYGVGNTGGPPAGFLGQKIDLGGGNINFGFLGRF